MVLCMQLLTSLIHSIHEQPTPWSRVLKMLEGSHLVVKLIEFYGTWRFITVFTTPYPDPDKSSPVYCILFLWDSFQSYTPHLHISVPNSIFSSGFPTTRLTTFLFSHKLAAYPDIPSSPLGHRSDICLGVHIINLLNTQFTSSSSYFLLLRLNVLQMLPISSSVIL